MEKNKAVRRVEYRYKDFGVDEYSDEDAALSPENINPRKNQM